MSRKQRSESERSSESFCLGKVKTNRMKYVLQCCIYENRTIFGQEILCLIDRTTGF